MTIITGKKGQLLLYGLIAGLIAAVTIAYIDSVKDKKEFPVIGDSSLRFMDLPIRAEKALLYIDQSAKYSAYQIIYDLAKDGGCNSGKKYFDLHNDAYTLWDIYDKFPVLCTPSTESSKKIFITLLPNKVDNYLSKYEPLDLILNNYGPSLDNNNFILDNNNLIGIATEPLIVREEVPPQLGEPDENGIYKYEAPRATPIWYKDIGDGNWEWTPYEPPTGLWMPVTTTTVTGGDWEGKRPVKANILIINYLNDIFGAYSIKPSFNVDIGYNFSDYDELNKTVKKFKEICKDRDPFICIEEKKEVIFTEGNFELIKCGNPHEYFEFLDFFPEVEPAPGYRSKIYRFCVNRTISRFHTYDEVDDKIIPRNIVYKFAVKFEDIACYEDEEHIPINTNCRGGSPCDKTSYCEIGISNPVDPSSCYNTQCRKESCDKYFFCQDKNILDPRSCYCPNPDEGSNACDGECPKCACTPWEKIGCGGRCGSDEILERQCKSSSCGLPETMCGSCDPACDDCGCGECPEEDDEPQYVAQIT